MDPVIRRANHDDTVELQRLEQMARANIAAERGGQRRLEECQLLGQGFAEMIDQQDHRIFLSMIGEVPVGYLVLQLRPNQDRGVVTHVFVEEPARELGFGDAMLRAAIDETAKLGLAGIEGTALPGDRETKNLFERCGLVARKITVYKRISDEGASDPASSADASL